MPILLQLRRWLGRPVFEDSGIDRPFRLRRASLVLLAAGWLTFLASCLIGTWLVRHGVPLCGWAMLWRGGEPVGLPALQWTGRAAEVLGAASFFAGLFSVPLFDKRDRIPVWRAD